jgi:hypothetical protein
VLRGGLVGGHEVMRQTVAKEGAGGFYAMGRDKDWREGEGGVPAVAAPHRGGEGGATQARLRRVAHVRGGSRGLKARVACGPH